MPEKTDSHTGACKRFECKVIGYPRPSVRWYKDGQNITTHRRYKFDYTPDGCIVLIIDKVIPSDQGVYACRAENSEGIAESSALLHVKGGVPIREEDLESVHSMKFRLVDSQKRPLIFDQNRQDSSDVSEDSVLDGHSEILNGVNGDSKDIEVDADNYTNGDIENSKWEINGETDNSNGLNDDSVVVTVDSNTNNIEDKRNLDELFAETLADIENSREPKTRRWTADSGIISRGSSFSSDPDVTIDHESVLEMQKYLHGKTDAIFEPYENDKLKETNTEDFEKAKTKLVSEKPFVDIVKDQQTESRTKEVTEESDFIDKKNKRNLKMDNGNIAVLAYESYQEDDIGHHFCTSKHNHVDQMDSSVNWERVDDHEASVLAGKYLFAHGKDVEADEAIQPLSEWELIKQADGSLLFSADAGDGKAITRDEMEQLIANSRVESAGKTYIKESETGLIAGESFEISVKRSEIKREGITESEIELLETKTSKTQFSADTQDIEVKETGSEVISTKVTKSEAITETVLNEVTEVTKSSVIKSLEQSEVNQMETDTNVQERNVDVQIETSTNELNKQLDVQIETDSHIQNKNLDIRESESSYDLYSSTDEYFCSTDDEALYDLDVDRSEQIMQTRSKQYRRASAQDNVTSEMVEQISAKQALSIQSDSVSLESESKTEIRVKQSENVAMLETDDVKKTISGKSDIEADSQKDVDKVLIESDSINQELSALSDDDAYELDLDRSEQMLATKSQQIRRLSAQDNLTKEKIDQLSVQQSLIASESSVSLEAETKQMPSKGEATSSDDKLLSDEPTDRTDGNMQVTETTVSTETTETTTSSSNDGISKVETNAQGLQAAKEPSLFEATVESEILDTHETGLDIEAIESVSVQSKDEEKKQTTPFDKLSSAEKDDILKQISDISLAKGRRFRGKEETGNADAETEDKDDTATDLKSGTEDLKNSHDVKSDVKEDEKPVIKVDRQLSLTGETVFKEEKTDAELLKDQLDSDDLTPLIQKVSGQDALDTSSTNNLTKESELNLDQENVQVTDKNLKIVDSKTIEKVTEGKEDEVLFAKIENAKEPTPILYQAEETAGEKGLNSPTRKGSLEMLEDTKPAVPNIINFVDELKHNTDVEYQVEEATHTAQDLKTDTDVDAEHAKAGVEEVKENIAVASEEQAGVITEKVEVSNSETVKDGRAEISESVEITDTINGKKNDENENRDIAEESEVTSAGDAEQISINADADTSHKAQELKSEITSDIESKQADEKDSKEANAEISEEQTSVVTDAVDISTVETTNDIKTVTSDIKEEKKTGDDMLEISSEIEATQSVNVEQTPVESDAEAVIKAQELKNDIALSSELEEDQDKGSKEVIAEVNMEESDTQTEVVQNETVMESISENLNAETKQKIDSVEVSELPSETSVNTESNIEQSSIKLDVDLESNVGEIKAEETIQLSTGSTMDEKQDEKIESLSIEKQQITEIKTIDNDDVDAALSKSERTVTEVSKAEQEITKKIDETVKIIDQEEKVDVLRDTKYKPVDDKGTKEIDVPQEGVNEHTAKTGDQQISKIDTADLKVEPVAIKEGESVTMRWQILDTPLKEIEVTKDGIEVEINDRFTICSVRNVLVFHIEPVKLDDEGVYTIKGGKSELEDGAVLLKVVALESSLKSEEETEPAFVVEPVVEKHDDRRMSIKCSVSGVPKPTVAWYRHGQPLGSGEFWDVYSQDDYHFLSNSETGFLECEEIVCRVENDVGYIQSVLKLDKKGDEIKCQPVQREAKCQEISTGPHIELQVTETNDTKLQGYTVTAPHVDDGNKASVTAGESVELLGTWDAQQWLVRLFEQPSKICYVPNYLLQANVAATDARQQVCENVAPDQLTEQTNTELQKLGSEETSTTMPERRKIVPGSKLHGTRDDRGDSPSDIESKLGFKDDLDKKKDVSDTILPEYEDGTSRPMFKKRLRTIVTRTGELVQMECIVRGSPLPKVLWLKNNRPLKESDNCQVIADEETNMLIFPNVTEDDIGVYTARAMNVNGSVMCSAELSLEDGRPLPFSDTAETPMDLDFTTPNYFFQMSSCQVAEGRLARFDCRVVAHPRPEIVWMRDGKVVQAGDRFRLLNMNNEIYSLLIQDVQMSDTGRYTCWARNKFGEAMTEAYLNVIAFTEQQEDGDMAPKFLTRFYDQQTTEGMLTEFKSLIAGKPEPSVTWLLDDIELKDAPGMRQRHKDSVVSLELKSPKVEQSGQYTCQLRNALGEATCSARLTVIEDKLHGRMLPKFLRKFDHLNVKDGEEAKFSCVIVGEPKADVVWMYDHKPIPDSNRRFIARRDGDNYSLTIKNARMDDTGIITCKAVNDEGEVYCSANLNVREAKYGRETPERVGMKPEQKDSKFGYVPTFTRRLQDVQVAEGATAKFECKVMGIPQPEVTWMKDGRVIPAGGRYKMIQDGDTCFLHIDKVSASDAGVYTCIVSNNQGKSSSLASLRIEGLPPKDKYIPEKPMDTYMKKERYTPEKILDDTYTRKPRYTPERFLEDTYAKKRYTPDRFLEDTYAKKRYGTPEKFFDDYTKRQYTPERYIDDTYAKRTRYTPESRYTPDYLEDTYAKRYTPDRYTLPESYLDQTSLKQPYSPAVKTEAIPKMAYEKPTLLNKTDESVRLSWAPVSVHNLPADSRRVSYVVESRELPSSVWTKVAYNVPTSSYLVRHLRPDKEYEFRVRAQNQRGVSEPSRTATMEKRVDDSKKYLEMPEVKAPPRLPTHRPIITDLGEEMVRLAWRPVESYKSQRVSPVSYQVEAKELPGKDWMPISTRLRDTSHYLSELEADRDYLIRVRAENDFGVSEPTEPLWLPRAKVFPGVPISRPQIVEMEPHKAKLSWSRVDVPAFGLDDVPLTYMLEVEEPPKDWRTLARDLDDTEYIIEGLKPERDYRFRVRAKTPTGIVSEPSPAVSLYTTLARKMSPVDRLEVLDYEPDTRSLQLQWQRVDIPPYSSDEEPLMYMLEYQEPPLPDWRPLVTGIPTTRYRVMHLDPERDYNFRVRALTPYGVSQPSPALPVSMRQPTAFRHLPEDVTVSEVESDSVRLSWRRPMVDLSQPISYQVEMLEPFMVDWRPVATRVTDTTYKVTGLKPDRDYKFRVVPYADTRALPSTPVVGLTSSPVRPRLHLSEPSLREMGPESVQLSWQPAELPLYQRSRTPVHYKVEMMELPSSSWVPVARRVPETSYLVSGLKADRDYKFRVLAETDLATSEPSLAAVLHRKPAPIFPRAEPTIRDFTPNAVMLSWQPATVPSGITLPVSTPVFYSVEAQSPPGMGAWLPLYTRHPTPSVKLSELRPDLDYLVRVRAHYDDFTSEPTLPVYIPRRAAPPRIPHEEPYAVDIGTDYIKLQWRSADLPVHIMDYAPVTYRIEAQELPGGNWVTVARGVPHTDFKVTGLSPKNDYCFRIRAENDFGTSDPTRPVTVGRRAVAPILPHDEPLMYDLAPGSVRLSWRPATMPPYASSASPVTYTIFVQELPYKNWRPYVKRVPQTAYHVLGLNPDKDYNFRVQAENEFGTSKPTAAVYMPRMTDIKRPILMPEIDDFDEDLTSVKLHWKPRAGSPFDMDRNKYLIESWEPVKREWYPIASGIPDTSYQLRDLPAASDRLFRVRLETEKKGLSEPSVPVSVSRFYSMRPVHRPQLYELDNDSVRLSWEPAIIAPGQSRRPIRYIVEMREIPDKTWNKVAFDVLDTNYKIRGLRSKHDYEFRVRALIDGETSEPSLPVPLYRRPEIPKVRLDVPEVYDVADDSLSLRWNKVDIPTFSYDDEPLSFMIERQTLPGYKWEPVATNLTGTSYRIQDLKPYQDYAFRVRGVYPSGYTEPSPLVPVYRRPIRLSVPIARPEVWEDEPSTAHLRWQPAYIPSYHSLRPKRYRIEMQEAGPTSIASDWKPVADDVTTPDFTVKDLSPRKDYNFRIRAEMENGDISEPTPPIQYYRSQVPMSKEPFALGEYKPVDYEITLANRTYVDHLTKYVPPRLPIDKPQMVVINPETVELAWKPAKVPDSIKYSSNLTYTIEVRNPPSFEWRELVSGLKQLNNTVKKLHPRVDYIFRIRAWNEYGPSEPSLPVSLYRPVQHDHDASYDEDEAFEKEWELRFGQQGENTPLAAVPPKLPMDTPKVITQSPESIWFSWIPARIPAYATQTPITYVIEVKEPPETSWKRAHEGLLDCQFTYEGMNPTRDYHIRVRAETQFGPSEPTLPIFIKRSGSRPGSRRSSLERDLKADEVKLDTTALENLATGVPPRMSSNRPLSSNVQPSSLTLSWPAGRVPSYVKNQTISYIIEKREPPGHIWTVLAKEIQGTKYDIKGLNPEQDYMFRVRARNDFGTSDPTLPMTLYRERDDYVPQKIRSRSGSRDSIQALVSRRRRSSSSILDFDYLRSGSEEVDVCVKDQIPTQPEYTSAPKWDTQYGVESKKGKIVLQVRGYPLPTIHWYLNDEKLDYGDNYTASLSANGTVTLEIKQVRQDSYGTYKCYAENEHGAAVKFVKYEYADPPTVLEPLKDIFIGSHNSAKFTCRVDGIPCPTAKWTKDWHPIKDSTRIKVVHEAPDVYSLEIINALSSDGGLYACTMENMAGKVTMTARLVIEDQEPGPAEIELKKSPIEDSYHILEEIGRSRQGVIRRVIEKQTGKVLAGNFIFCRNKAQKNFFMTEFEILRLNQYDNVLKLHDAFETERSLVLVTELLTGSDLLTKVVADGNWTEAKAADVIKRILGVLQILGAHNIQHLDIKPSNIYLSGEDNQDVKLINFALSRQLLGDEDLIHNYGSIGYASPEQVGEDIITDRTDIWGIGVLAYILLAGESPFKGTNDFEVLNKTKTCDWDFNEAFASFSEEAKDFISKLLQKNASDRLSVDDCLKHPWLSTTNEAKLNTEKLNSFNEADRQQREANKSSITANLQSFNKILHGASALYQPAMDQVTGEIIFPDTEEYGNFLSEDAWYEWQLHYMDDPDSQYFPLDNKDFTVRESRDSAADGDLKGDKKEQETSDSDSAIMFRNKIQTTPFIVGEDVTFTCTVISPKSPAIVTWYRDEQLLGEDTYRVEAQYSAETGEASLRLTNLKDYDAAIYKCVARNKDGRVSCEARLLLGDVPGKPGRAVVTQSSGSEVFLTWSGPVSDGNSYILGYRIDYKKTDEDKWTRGPFVTDEYALVSGLVPTSQYIFRVSCHNKYGASQYSWASLPVTTGSVDAPKIEIAKYLKPVLEFSSFDKQQLILQAASRRPSLKVVADAKINEGNPDDSYKVLESIGKGKFGEYKLCSSVANNKHYVMKAMPFKADNKDTVLHEFNILSNLRQVNIVTVYEGFISGETLYVIFERLSGVNVVQYLCLRKFYSEEIVSRIVRQILDGLQYLQQAGVVHLNLQPSSVVMATRRRLHVKLRDFTQARKLENWQEEKITPSGYPDFIAPEILREEPAGFPADVWGLGVLTFVMLSGTSPFGGADRQETLNRIMFDRYCTSAMYDNVSKEGLTFVTKMLKRLPKNRATVNKCLESKWLQLTDSMIKTRNTHLFRTETLRDFSELYLERKGDNQYMDLAGVSGESLAKPTVGPHKEPIHSKRLPKYRKFITKPQPQAPVELDIDSASSIASDFSSILDKIDALREAIYSGSELPERKTKSRKYLREEKDIRFTRKSAIEDDFLSKTSEQDIEKDLVIPEKVVGSSIEENIEKPKDIVNSCDEEVKNENVEEKLVEAPVSDLKNVEKNIDSKDLEISESSMSVKDESVDKKTNSEMKESSLDKKPGQDLDKIDGNVFSKPMKTGGELESVNKKDIEVSKQDLDKEEIHQRLDSNERIVEAINSEANTSSTKERIILEAAPEKLSAEKQIPKASSEDPKPDARTGKPASDEAVEQLTTKEANNKPSEEPAVVEKPYSEKPTATDTEVSVPGKTTPDAAADMQVQKKSSVEKPTSETASEMPTITASAEKSEQEKIIPEKPISAVEELTQETSTAETIAEKSATSDMTSAEKPGTEKPITDTSAERPVVEMPEKPSPSVSAEKTLTEETSEKAAEKPPTDESKPEMSKPEAAMEKPDTKVSEEISRTETTEEKPSSETSEMSTSEKPILEAEAEKIIEEQPNSEVVSEKLDQDVTAETKPETSEVKTDIVEEIVKPTAAIENENVSKNEPHERVVVEDVIESKQVNKENALPNFEVQDSTLKEKESEIVANDVLKENIEEDKELIQELEISKDASDGNEQNTNIEKSTPDVENDIKTSSENDESKTEDDKSLIEESKTDDKEPKSDSLQIIKEESDPLQNIKEHINKLKQDIDKKINQVANDEKRESVSTISTESEYLDAISCADHKDMKCQHNHESTPDSQYTTAESDASKRSSVADGELEKAPDLVEKETVNMADIKEITDVESKESESNEESNNEKSQKSMEVKEIIDNEKNPKFEEAIEKEIIEKSDEESLKTVETNEKLDVTEKSDIESVKEKDESSGTSIEKMDKTKDVTDDSSGLSKEDGEKSEVRRDGSKETTEGDGDILDKEKKILAEAEKVAEKVVTEALDDALKVAEC